MAILSLGLRNATDSIRLTIESDENTRVQDLLAALCGQVGLPDPGSQGLIGRLFETTSMGAALYDPRRGILDPDRTLEESGVKPDDTLRFYCRTATSASFSSINLSEDRVLSDVALCVVVEWRDSYYPVILPIKATPQGGIEGSLLNYCVLGQIAGVAGRPMPNNWLEAWRYQNARTQAWIDPQDATASLGNHLKHGDHIRLFPPEEITLLGGLEEDSILADVVLLDDVQASSSAEQDLLDQIQLQPGKVHAEADSPDESLFSAKIDQATIELVRGDITQQVVDVIVNAANSSLRGGGGVDGAIHKAAGPQLAKASCPLAPCPPGDAVLTPGFQLPAMWVIHTVGPRYEDGTKGEAETLRNAYRSSLELAINSKLTSIAFPSISTGAYGYPVEEAARIALKTTSETLEERRQAMLVRFVLYGSSDYEAYRRILTTLVQS